jgi:FkbM family methyltransferase
MFARNVVRTIFEKMGMDLSRHKKSSEYTLLGLRDMDFDVIIDVGAHEGQYLRKFLKIFPKAEIYAFEPLKKPFAKLDKLVRKNGVHTYNIAIGDKVGRLQFFEHVDYTGSSSFLESEDILRILNPVASRQKKIRVKMSTLDNAMLAKIREGQTILIKIDVEGYEERVLRGGKKIFAKANACIIEINFIDLFKGQPKFAEIHRIMESLGFEYKGNINQLAIKNGVVLHVDALFLKRKLNERYHAGLS